MAYKAHIISTIVDFEAFQNGEDCLQGSYNFYYCRSNTGLFSEEGAYKAHIISTIVDPRSSKTVPFAYKAHIISTIVDNGIKSML